MASCKLGAKSIGSRSTLSALFIMMILNLVMFPLLTSYWQRNNNGPLLTPNDDYRLEWIPDADFRALDTTDKPTVQSVRGKTMYVAGETWKQFRPYYVASPDGQWHLAVMARGSMSPYATRSVLGVVIPALVFCIVGLALCLFSRNADTSGKKVAEPVDCLA